MALTRESLEKQLKELEQQQNLFALTAETAKRNLDQTLGAIKLCKFLLQDLDPGDEGAIKVEEEGA